MGNWERCSAGFDDTGELIQGVVVSNHRLKSYGLIFVVHQEIANCIEPQRTKD